MKFWAYVNIFHLSSWSCLIATIICIAVAFTIIRITGVEIFHDHNDSERFGFLNAISLNLQLLIQKDYQITKESSSTKFLFLTFCLTSFLLFSFYSADLTSLMASGSSPSFIKSFKDAYDMGYDILVLGGSSLETAIL